MCKAKAKNMCFKLLKRTGGHHLWLEIPLKFAFWWYATSILGCKAYKLVSTMINFSEYFVAFSAPKLKGRCKVIKCQGSLCWTGSSLLHMRHAWLELMTGHRMQLKLHMQLVKTADTFAWPVRPATFHVPPLYLLPAPPPSAAAAVGDANEI